MTTHLSISTYYNNPTSFASSQGFDHFVAGEDETGTQQTTGNSYSGELYYVVNGWIQYYGSINAWNIKYNPSTQVWTDNSTDEEQPFYITQNTTSTAPGHVTTDTTTANPQYVFGYGQQTSQLLFAFLNPYYSSGAGSTQTYIRTTHTGTILNTTLRKINRPDYDTSIGAGGLQHNEDYYFRKIGNHRIRLRWHDQNEAPTYVCSCHVEISPGVYDQYLLGILQGTGDVQWDIDTSNGSGHSGFNPNNLPVMHNGNIYISFSDPVHFGGNLIPAGNMVKEWTYLGVGPFSASFTPSRAKEGEQVTLGFKDDNPFPDSSYTGSYEAPDGTSADMRTNNPSLGNVNPYTLQVSVQKGHYKIYEAGITHRASNHIIAYHRFVRGGKVSSNFW